MAGDLDYLKKQGDSLFTTRHNLLNLWQTLADNFYPERADFTTVRSLGEEFASGLMTSYPLLTRRDLGNSFGSMLRPTSKEWFKVVTDNYEKIGADAKAWLEWATRLQKRAMYDKRAMMVRATSEGDQDFATFGQCAISVEMNMREMCLLYRCWHLRDVAWAEDEVGQVGTLYRKWKPTAISLQRTFGKDNIHPKVAEAIKNKQPLKEFNVWHCLIPVDHYDGTDKNGKPFTTPFVSIYFDRTNNHEIECVGAHGIDYVLPRWQTVSGSQYAYSPATVAALPDARLIQSMTRVLLEAGEKAVDPPMVAVQDMIRSDISIYAGGITWVDADYDERLGDVLRPISQNTTGIPLGVDMSQGVMRMIREAFYLDKLALPPPDARMTAYEVGHRVQEYIRQALPLFEPMEMEYNGRLCDLTFDVLQRYHAFGSPHDKPKELINTDVQFQFESPLREATERAKGQRFIESKEMLAHALDIDPGAKYVLDVNVALRDVFEGIGVPFKWTRSTEEAQALSAAEQQSMQAQDQLAQMTEGAKAAKLISEASRGQQQAAPVAVQ